MLVMSNGHGQMASEHANNANIYIQEVTRAESKTRLPLDG
jgi:hypothetical protein